MIGEAAHGGSIVVRVPDGFTSMLAKQQGGPSNWFASALTVNAQRVELDAAQATSSARYAEVDLWNTSTSSFQFTSHRHRDCFSEVNEVASTLR